MGLVYGNDSQPFFPAFLYIKPGLKFVFESLQGKPGCFKVKR